MPVDLQDPWLSQVLERSNTDAAEFPDLTAYLHAACQPMAGYTNAILEVSRCGLHKTPDGSALGSDLGLLVVFRFECAFVQPKGIINKRLDVRSEDYKRVSAVVEDGWTSSDGRCGDFDVQFLAAGQTPLMRLAWDWWRKRFSDGTNERIAAATERDRILQTFERCLARDFASYGD
jgi:hypothetical protein